MTKTVMSIGILAAVVSFTAGVYCSAVRHLPVNPDVQATVNQLKYGMDVDDVLSIVRMSFVLQGMFVVDRKQNNELFGRDLDIDMAIKGNVPALAISYDLWLGFSTERKLLALNYYPVHGYAWFFYPKLKAHIFHPLSDSGFYASIVDGDGVDTNVVREVVEGTKGWDDDRWQSFKIKVVPSKDPNGGISDPRK